MNNVNLTELLDDNITDQVNKLVQQVDSALADSANSLICGPDCQSQENIKTLKQLYLDAELNLKTAPENLTVAEKNYLVSVLGEDGYSDDYLEDLYENYYTINTNLKTDINKATGDVVTNDRKTYYETQNNNYLKNWYVVYKFIYIVIIIVFIIFLFVKKSEYSFISRVLILIFFILYPIYITKTVFWIWNKVILRIWELLPSNIYKSI